MMTIRDTCPDWLRAAHAAETQPLVMLSAQAGRIETSLALQGRSVRHMPPPTPSP